MPVRTSEPAVVSNRTRMLLLVLGSGAATGLHLGLLHWFAWRSWLAPVTFLAGSLIYAGTTYVLWRWVLPRIRLQSPWAQILAETVVCVGTFTLISSGTVQGLAALIPSGTAGRFSTLPAEVRRQWIHVYMVLPILPTSAMAMIGYHLVYRRMHVLVSQAARLRELAATAQLGALRAQLNPHFLFNSLNSIAQLIHTDPDKAEEHVERLADILRYVLRSSEREFVRLADELHVTEAYLAIERDRFDDRLRVDASIEPAALERLVPNLVLQPLVENAVKHGLASKLGPGTVSISARVIGDGLRLSVTDDGIGMDDATLATVFERGVGLRNLREWLTHLYGLDEGPAIESAPGRGTTVEVLLPLAARGTA